MSIERSREPERFGAFELSGWDDKIGGYDAAFGGVARQTVQPMLDAARIVGGMDVLDVCCGPGMLAEGALARGARATGLDFSEAAVALARKLVPGGQFRQGDAQALPFAAASFDAVLCGYGVMHLPDPGTALAEMLRVLRPGGRLALSAWDALGASFALVHEAVRARGAVDVGLPHGPDFFQFGSLERMIAGLTDAGFADVTAYSVALHWRLANADRYIESILTGTVRASAILAAQSGTAADAVRDYIAEQLTRFKTAGGELVLPMPAIVGSGARGGSAR
jgi:SAM-dependent methyltransferase